MVVCFVFWGGIDRPWESNFSGQIFRFFGGVVSWCLTYSGIRPYGHQWAYFGCSHVEAAPARLAVIRLDGLRSDDVSSLNWTCVGDPAYYESILATTVKPRSVR